MKTINLTSSQFLELIADYQASKWKYLGDRPAIIDFYADWCGPCKAIAPILEELATEFSGRIYIYKVNTEQEQELSGRFNIRSIPSILFIPMRGKLQMVQGALPKAQLRDAIQKILLIE